VAAAQLVIDTDIIIDHLRQRGDTLRLALARYRCAITAITLYELLAVPTLSERQTRQLEQLLDIVQVIVFDQYAAEQSAIVWRMLAARSQSIGLPDTLVAGVCLANKLPLLTRNHAHFSRVDNLTVFNPEEFAK
jgi:predicted nucleic acid-binding protein